MNKNDNLNILVSGGAGFVGSNIVNAYIENGHRVWVADNLSSGFIENLNPKADFFNIDIRDEKLENIFKKVNFNIVNHHAAQTNIRKSLENPIFDSQVNVIGTLNILESCKKYNIKKIIFASSGGAIYGESEFPKKEIDKKKPISPYGIAKYANELYIEFYTSTYNISYSILRYSNIYGYRQNVNGEIDVISNFINKILNNEKVNIYGDGNQIRDYIFIEDVVKANLNTLDHKYNGTFNVGTGNETSVNELFNYLKSLNDYKIAPNYLPKRYGEIQKSVLNIDKMKNELKITPISLRLGLKKTLNFYKNFYYKNVKKNY